MRRSSCAAARQLGSAKAWARAAASKASSAARAAPAAPAAARPTICGLRALASFSMRPASDSRSKALASLAR